MPTLHIEHAITDFRTWLAAFGRFADARRNAGVRDERVHQPVGDPHYVIIDLDSTPSTRRTRSCSSSKPWFGRTRPTHRRSQVHRVRWSSSERRRRR